MVDRKIVLDVETTGLYPAQGHKIIEIACIELFDDEKIGKELHLYVNPKIPIPQEATNIHGIKDEDVANCLGFEEVYKDIVSFIGESKVIAHNAEFDRGFINYELDSIGQPTIPKDKFIDTLFLARKKFPNQKVSLDELCKKFEIDLSSRKDYHGALVDIKLLAQVYYNLLKGQKNIFDDNAKNSSKVNTQEALQDISFYEKTVFNNRQYVLSEDEEKEHIEFLKSMKKSIWLEKI